uniref:TRASH domain-containing protein n=1 Tax=Pyxicephalus adspersus TaxID=30357 RepID=A0AAV2ZJN0_PYXAD|nr:TPA: hypothetical protein GDO54_017052 [Pyxicephalus adspersus]
MESDEGKQTNSQNVEDMSNTPQPVEDLTEEKDKKTKGDTKGGKKDPPPQDDNAEDPLANDGKDDVVFVGEQMAKRPDMEHTKSCRLQHIEENGDRIASETDDNQDDKGPEGEKPVAIKRSKRARRSESLRAEGLASSESMQISDEDSDAMVDDPNDEDFIPSRTSTKHLARRSLRNQVPPKPTLTKMSCAQCRTPLQKGQTAFQRKGLPQLFCSSACLATFSKKPPVKKICTFCKNDICNSKDSVVAQTGVGGSFQEFCSSACLSLFEAQPRSSSESSSDVPDIIKCSICHKSGEIQHEVSNGSVVHRLCSDNCFTKFRATKGLKTNCCDNCGIYIYNKGLPLEYLFHEGQQKRFCNAACLNNYKKKNTKVYPCMFCKTLCKNFEMLSNLDKNGRVGLFCSICCITSHKVKQSGLTGPAHPCSLCRRTLSEPAYYNKTERVVYQFCSPSCWTKFQRTRPEGGIHLNCHYCHNMFTGKPEILDWQDHVYQFCCKDCCDDYKRLHGVISRCEYCKQEKLLHEKIRFSGVEKNFCSEGCVLLYKQDFTKNLGLCCITCTYCSQTCQRAVTEELDGSTWDFCSEECKSKYLLWYFKAARCHACKRQGKLVETIHWRGEIKHFCNQQCLLRFYNQQNQPNLDTQKGPESLLHSKKGESVETKTPNSQPKTDNSPRSTTAYIGIMASPKPLLPQVALAPPPPASPTVLRKNKAVMCKPLMQNHGVSCRVETRANDCQTEEDWKPQVIVLPIPVPIFVPMPINLYTQKVPVPFSLPLPVPVPLLLPTTLESIDKIVETIEELKVKIPSNPLEADILAMAEKIAEAEELDKTSDLCALKLGFVVHEVSAEARFPPFALSLLPGLGGPKRVLLSEKESFLQDPVSSKHISTNLSYTYGVNAWKSWVQRKYEGGEPSRSEEIRFGPKPMRIKEDILTCTAAELNYGLAQFVKEVTRPNGERYEPDSIFYLCLGIQQYLLENNRMVNIFTDLYYLTFVQELNKILTAWHRNLTPSRLIYSRVEEEHLWDCKQLGVYSPYVLLNTLIFFNTKFFGLRTAEQHMQLSLTNVVRHSRKCTTSRGISKIISICHYPPLQQKKGREGSSKRKRQEDQSIALEQHENKMNPLRCPVKFYEFYLSKCPVNLRNHADVFYLQPERSCVAESPLWYSVIPMDKNMLQSMLSRILAVREVYEQQLRGSEDRMTWVGGNSDKL